MYCTFCMHTCLNCRVAEDGRHSIRRFNTILQGVISQETLTFVYSFLAYFMMLSIYRIIQHPVMGLVSIRLNKWRRIIVLAKVEVFCRHLPGGTEKDHDVCNECLCQGRDFNPGPPEYEVVILNYNVTPLPRKCYHQLRSKYHSLPNLALRATDCSSLCCFVKYRQTTRFSWMKAVCPATLTAATLLANVAL